MKIKKIEIDLKHLFWTLFEELPEEKKYEFCGDSEFEFYCFRNSIKTYSDEQLLNEIAEAVQLLSHEKIKRLYIELLQNLYSDTSVYSNGITLNILKHNNKNE